MSGVGTVHHSKHWWENICLFACCLLCPAIEEICRWDTDVTIALMHPTPHVKKSPAVYNFPKYNRHWL
jgi:hypothetical protein